MSSMTADQVADLVKQLGLMSPLVGILIYMLQQTNSERREITTKFLASMESMQAKYADTQNKYAEQLGTVTHTLTELTGAVRERTAANAVEHQQQVSILQDMIREIRDQRKAA